MFREQLPKELLEASRKRLREAPREGLREARRKGLQEARRKGLRETSREGLQKEPRNNGLRGRLRHPAISASVKTTIITFSTAEQLY
jgi:flagellar biosynthesis/type III secretory pathway protein FliH